MSLTKPQRAAFTYWRRMWRFLCGSARADLENAFAAGWLAGYADRADYEGRIASMRKAGPGGRP